MYVGTSQDVGFTWLRDRRGAAWRRAGRRQARIRASVDEMDEAFVYSDSPYIRQQGAAGAAPDAVAAQVRRAAEVITGGLASGKLTAADFGRAEGQAGGGAELTAAGKRSAAEALGIGLPDGGEPDGDLVRRLNMAATAHFGYVENVHYVLHDGRVVHHRPDHP